ncbi:MAG: hypothetical protein KJ886_06060 [Candidatus Thermoplasmatota archaeon]|nr:hypothetical protein [Candidatus Thermoplasmatota archaeon]
MLSTALMKTYQSIPEIMQKISFDPKTYKKRSPTFSDLQKTFIKPNNYRLISMNNKIISIIILCLMLLSTLPLSLHSTGGEQKTAKTLVKNLEDEMQKKEKKKESEK